MWLRVERQTTVPLTAANASLFLIRVYHYSLAELSAEQRTITLEALAAMPEEVRAYKALPRPAALVAWLAQDRAGRTGVRANEPAE